MARITVTIYYDAAQPKLEVTTKDVYGEPDAVEYELTQAKPEDTVRVTKDGDLGGSLYWLAEATGYDPMDNTERNLTDGQRVRVYPGAAVPKRK